MMTSKLEKSEKFETSTLESKDSVIEDQVKLREAPDGGISWLSVIGCFCGLFATQGYGYSWGVYLDYYNSNVYPGELTNLTWIGSLWFGLTNITGPFYVYLCGKIGYRWMIGVACILSCFSMMMASLTTAVWQLYITQGVMSGIASSLIWFPCISAPQQWFSSKRGLAVGLGISGSGLGGLAISKIVGAAIDSVGYRWSLRILGFIQLVLMGISFFTVRPLNPLPRDVPFFDLAPFKNKKFWVLCCIHCLGNFAFYIPSSFVPSYATSLGLPSDISRNLSAVMSGIMVVGKILNGCLSDYFGRVNVTFLCSVMTGVICLAVWMTAETAASMWAFAVLFGIFGGGYVSMIAAVIADCVGIELIESATGWLYFAWIFGGLFGQPLSAVIIEQGNLGYKGAIIFAGVIFLFVGLLAGILRFMKSGPKLFAKV
ncbi:major facilitator superfamily domain-containing protein [Halteromyces radiatus]|uniref:major facilitator superfamily domain-containing protein n=1 Tax=Halteromyces radiatus TaxID=101107 RepID=UPI00221E71A8|nr:major facilitator superfamily domain-containing protein [Halteromyces radiatus]KAI8092657.1 major facilitator superfamily domain-containing protein [Halteromyces radiatus]